MLTKIREIDNLANILAYVAAIALPNIFLFNIYTQNHETSQIIFHHVLILALLMGITGALGFFIARFLTKTAKAGLLVMLLFWLFFWFFEDLFARVSLESKGLFLGLIAGGLIAFTGLLRLCAVKLQKGQLLLVGFAGVLSLLFVFNAIGATFAFFTTTAVETNQVAIEVPIKHDFTVDATLPSPDIYWLHMDGMISPHSMEYFFGNAQTALLNRLLDLGFVINNDAKLVAHNTEFGVSALLSPYFYDNYLQELFSEAGGLLRRGRQSLLHGALNRDGISLALDVAPYHELFHAFMQANYTGVMIADFARDVYVPIDQFYRLGNGLRIDAYPFTTAATKDQEPHFLTEALDLVELLALMTPIPYRIVIQIREGMFDWVTIPSHDEVVNQLMADSLDISHERQLYRRLQDSFAIDEPKLLYLTTMFTHAARWHWQDPELTAHRSGVDRFDLASLAYEYAAKVMLQLIDLILANNPNAIIVIQADHGMHLHATQQQLLNTGFSEEAVIQLQNSVISAVLIPPSYGGLDEALDPRNITRELVNRFVGQNYDLIE